MKLNDRIARFFYGRNGVDQLSRFVNWVAVILLLLSIIANSFISATVGSVSCALGILGIIYFVFRTTSKNIQKRRLENERYLNIKSRIHEWFLLQRNRIKYRKTYIFFTCPSCRCVLRVPRGKGNIRITCHKCGEMFVKKT